MEKIMFIKNHDYGHKILQSLYELQKRGVNCDITLTAHDGSIHVHRLILLASSSVDCQKDHETIPSYLKNSQIDCTKYTINTVNAVVHLMYTGEIKVEQRYSSELNSLCKEMRLSFACTMLKLNERSQKLISKTVPCKKQNLINVNSIYDLNQNSGFSVKSEYNEKNSSSLSLELQHDENEGTLFDQPECFDISVPYIDDDSVHTVHSEHTNIDNEHVPYTDDDSVHAAHSVLSGSGSENDMYMIGKDVETNINTSIKTEMLDESSDEKMLDPLQLPTSPNIRRKLDMDIPLMSKSTRGAKQLSGKLEMDGTSLYQKNNISDMWNQEYTSLEQLPSNSSGPRKRPSANRNNKSNKVENCKQKKRKKEMPFVELKQKSDLPVDMAKENEFTNIPDSCQGEITERTEDHEDSGSETERQEITEDADFVSKTSNELFQDAKNEKKKKKQHRKCVKCNIEFKSYTEKTKHMSEVHRPFPCDLCDWVGPYAYKYASHMYGQHKIVIYPDKFPLIECEEKDCSFKCLSMHIGDHKRKHRYKIEKPVCDICGLQFTSIGGLRTHAESHMESTKKFPCDKCGKVYDWKRQLQSHQMGEHIAPKLCHQCPYKARSQSALTIHLHQKHGEPIPENKKIYKCDSCDFYCFYRSYLRDHTDECHSDIAMYECKECTKSFKSMKSLKTHQSIHKANKDKYKCSQCDYTTPFNNTLKAHSASSHSEINYKFIEEGKSENEEKGPIPFSKEEVTRTTSEEIDNFQCEHCHRSYKTKGSLTRHIVTNSEEKTLCCPLCDKTFFHKNNLYQHMDVHQAKDHIICDECGKNFKSKGALYNHKRVKHRNDGIKCLVCNKSFVDNYHVQRHMRVHNEEKQECTKCGKFFKHLKEHMGICQQVTRHKAYHCDICESKFKEKRYLDEHKRYKHFKCDRYVCDGCGEKFSHRRTFIEHKKKCQDFQSFQEDFKVKNEYDMQIAVSKITQESIIAIERSDDFD